jgi:GTP-binding protein
MNSTTSLPAIVDATFRIAAQSMASLPPALHAEVAFAGRSNVGKSSVINTLVQRRKLVRTSGTPGCTRGINIFHVQFQGGVLDFVDLPGYGYAQRSKAERRSWGGLIETFLKSRAGLSAVVVIVDIRRGLEPDDQQLLDYLKHLKRKAIVVSTKLDKLPMSKRKLAVAQLQKSAGVPVVGFSSETGDGRETLMRRILSIANVIEVPTNEHDNEESRP